MRLVAPIRAPPAAERPAHLPGPLQGQDTARRSVRPQSGAAAGSALYALRSFGAIRAFLAGEFLVHPLADAAEALPVHALLIRHVGAEAFGIVQGRLVDRPTAGDEPTAEVVEAVIRADAVVRLPCFPPVAILGPINHVVEYPGEF